MNHAKRQSGQRHFIKLKNRLENLIKPQFELQREDVGRGGIVSDPALHEKAQRKVAEFVAALGHVVVGIVASLITGTDGNQEFFICARRRSA